jgi:hypothetical protein
MGHRPLRVLEALKDRSERPNNTVIGQTSDKTTTLNMPVVLEPWARPVTTNKTRNTSLRVSLSVPFA